MLNGQKKIKYKIKKIMPFLLVLVLLTASFSPVLAEEEETGAKKANTGLEEAAGRAYGGENGSVEASGIITDIPTAVGRLIGAVLSFIGVIFLVLMIYGGLTWMTARGNEAQVAKAKDLIQTAIIGLIIVLMAYAITAFIAGKIATGE